MVVSTVENVNAKAKSDGVKGALWG